MDLVDFVNIYGRETEIPGVFVLPDGVYTIGAGPGGLPEIVEFVPLGGVN